MTTTLTPVLEISVSSAHPVSSWHPLTRISTYLKVGEIYCPAISRLSIPTGQRNSSGPLIPWKKLTRSNLSPLTRPSCVPPGSNSSHETSSIGLTFLPSSKLSDPQVIEFDYIMPTDGSIFSMAHIIPSFPRSTWRSRLALVTVEKKGSSLLTSFRVRTTVKDIIATKHMMLTMIPGHDWCFELF